MATVPDRDLLDLERQGWTALTKGGDAAAEFYGHVLAEQVLMLLPGGMVLSDQRSGARGAAGDELDWLRATAGPRAVARARRCGRRVRSARPSR